MKPQDLDLNLLHGFDALFAEGSVTRAAQRIGIGQPAMSDVLRRLRLLFGDPLFVRAGQGMRPTAKACDIAAEVAPLLAQMRAVMGERVAFLPESAARTFLLASTDFTTLVLLPPLVAALRQGAPNCALRIVGYEKDAVGAMLDRGEVDAALGVFPDPPPNTVASRLFEERFVGLARRDHPALSGGEMDLATFAGLPHALVSLRRDARGAVDLALAAQGLARRVVLVVPYMLMLPAVLRTSDLVAVVPARAARHVAPGDLVQFAVPVAVPPFAVDMLWSPTARSDRPAAWLRALIGGVARDI